MVVKVREKKDYRFRSEVRSLSVWWHQTLMIDEKFLKIINLKELMQ